MQIDFYYLRSIWGKTMPWPFPLPASPLQSSDAQMIYSCSDWYGKSRTLCTQKTTVIKICNVLVALNSVPLVVMHRSVLPLSCKCSLYNLFTPRTALPLVHVVSLMHMLKVSKGRVQHGLPRNIEVIESCQSLSWQSLMRWRKQESPERCYI